MTNSMRARLAVAFLILLAAFILQFWFASANIFINCVLTALILFAFYFEIWELLVFIALSFYIVAWSPAFSVEMVVFSAIPILAFGFHKIIALELWVGIPIAIAGGIALFYIAVAPRFFAADIGMFVIDLLGSLVFGGIAFLVMSKTGRR